MKKSQFALVAWVLFAAPAAMAQNMDSKPQVLLDAAEALGGLATINAVDNITLVGYGQRLYQFGGGNISGSAHAPLKWQAANDMRRVYDLENDRYQQLERRNFLFPFASSFGHNFALQNQILDGQIAWDVTGAPGEEQYTRAPDWNTNILYVDGMRMRRLWMQLNPVVAVRNALEDDAMVSHVRQEEGLPVIDVTLPEGDKYSLAFDSLSGLPAWVRWDTPHVNLGQIEMTTWFTGYAPFDEVMLPLGYNTEMDWRDLTFFRIYVDDYIINGDIADLTAPESVRNAPAVSEAETPEITAAQAGEGVWRLSSGTIVFEFEDHLTLYELGNPDGLAVIEAARALVPGKPVTEVIISHAHFDHVRGIRDAIAEGLTVIGRRGNEGIIREMAERDSPDFPDLLERNPRPLNYVPVDEHLRLEDEAMTVDIYWARANTHMADAVFAHVPDQNIFVEGDMATAAEQWQFWGDNYLDNIEHYGLEVDTLAPVHMPIMSHEDAVRMVGEGVERARAHCASELERGNYFPGCPIVSDRF